MYTKVDTVILIFTCLKTIFLLRRTGWWTFKRLISPGFALNAYFLKETFAVSVAVNYDVQNSYYRQKILKILHILEGGGLKKLNNFTINFNSSMKKKILTGRKFIKLQYLKRKLNSKIVICYQQIANMEDP